MKKWLAALICCVLTVSLIGCGGSAEPDPNAGVYIAKTVEALDMSFSAEEIFDSPMSIELLSNGKAELSLDGDTETMSWNLDGDRIEITDGDDTISGTLSSGVMIIDNFAGESMIITLECDSILERSGKTSTSDEENIEGQTNDPLTSGEDNSDSQEMESNNIGEINTEDQETDIYGYYDAICWAEWSEEGFSEENVYPLEEGEYLILNEDGSLDLMIEGEEYHYATTLEENYFYLDGTSVGAITEDGSIYLDLSDEIRYVYAREGHPAWDNWREYLGY